MTGNQLAWLLENLLKSVHGMSPWKVDGALIMNASVFAYHRFTIKPEVKSLRYK